MEARRDQRRRRLQDEIAEQRSPHRQRLNSEQAGFAQIGDGERIRRVLIVAAHGVEVDDRLQTRARLALVGLALAAYVQGRSDRVEQPSAR